MAEIPTECGCVTQNDDGGCFATYYHSILSRRELCGLGTKRGYIHIFGTRSARMLSRKLPMACGRCP